MQFNRKIVNNVQHQIGESSFHHFTSDPGEIYFTSNKQALKSAHSSIRLSYDR